jgi:FdhD protein
MTLISSCKTKAQIWLVENGKALSSEVAYQVTSRTDQLATEEPLEIRLADPRKTIAVTMRTPGADFELAAGFLYSEGVLSQKQDIQRISYCVDLDRDGQQQQNIVNVWLRSNLNPDLQPLERHFYTTSACGVCGKASLEALQLRGCAVVSDSLTVEARVICRLPETLRSHQAIFSSTGGLHAAALFDTQGKLLNLQEDVGRHNALDKLVGSAFLSGELPWRDRIVLVSGRSSFEILQKSLMAGTPIVCAVSAPSSLAVALAQEFGITLIGFLRGERFNIYTHPKRILQTL